MRGQSTWAYRPYTRLCENEKKRLPYICRLAPYETACELEWFDHGAAGAHTVVARLRGDNKPPVVVPATGPLVRLEGLLPGREYEVYVCRADQPQAQSDLRLFRTGDITGTVVNYLHPKDKAFAFSGRYLCSPSLVKTPSGRLVVSMDVYGPRHAQNLTFVYTSDDGGETWRYACDLFPCFWGKLFWHDGRLWLLGMTAEYGDMTLGYSLDEGETWSKPITFFAGAGIRDEKGMHQAPTPVIFHEGRLWTGVEYGTWEMGGHENGLVSADLSRDLMDPESWTCTEFLPFDRSWPGAVAGCRWGCHEGNAVVGPDGEVYNFLRYQISNVFDDVRDLPSPSHGKAMLLKADKADPEKQLQFVAFVDFNGGMSKFSLRQDPVSGYYLALVNRVIDDTTPAQRNLLSLSVSKDLLHWTIVKDLIDATMHSTDEVGYQYVDFILDGEDIVYASRTAFNHAHNYHDSNYITFHREKDFRALLPDAPQRS